MLPVTGPFPSEVGACADQCRSNFVDIPADQCTSIQFVDSWIFSPDSGRMFSVVVVEREVFPSYDFVPTSLGYVESSWLQFGRSFGSPLRAYSGLPQCLTVPSTMCQQPD